MIGQDCTQHRRAVCGCRGSAGSSFERRWQMHCQRGNRAVDDGQIEVASRHYRQAVDYAQVAIGMARRAGAAVPGERLERWLSLWTISHLNHSDFLARTSGHEQGIQAAFEAYEQVVECLHDVRVAARVHRACLRHARHVLDGLMSLMKQAGIAESSAMRIRARAQALALGYWNVWA